LLLLPDFNLLRNHRHFSEERSKLLRLLQVAGHLRLQQRQLRLLLLQHRQQLLGSVLRLRLLLLHLLLQQLLLQQLLLLLRLLRFWLCRQLAPAWACISRSSAWRVSCGRQVAQQLLHKLHRCCMRQLLLLVCVAALLRSHVRLHVPPASRERLLQVCVLGGGLLQPLLSRRQRISLLRQCRLPVMCVTACMVWVRCMQQGLAARQLVNTSRSPTWRQAGTLPRHARPTCMPGLRHSRTWWQ
jgi:hypothetical protein